MRIKLLSLAAGAAGMLLLSPAGASAQAPADADSSLVYQREVFHYGRGGRPDPFRSLLNSEEFGYRIEDMSLTGVMYNANPSRSVAVLSQNGASRRIRVRVGDRLGGIRIVSIRPRSVDVLIEEFGVARRETLELKPAQTKGS